MAIEITVPRLGWSMEEGAFAGWLKNPGDTVTPGEPLFAVESDKVTMDVESLDAGTLYIPPGAPERGDVVYVGQLLGYLLAAGEAAPVHSAVAAAAPVPAPAAHAPAPAPAAAERRVGAVTPRARRIAAELGVDTSALTGTGRDGRIREADVRAAASSGQPLSATRRTIAARLSESHARTVPVTLTTRADATALTALRPQASYNAILAKLAATALARHPQLAARWDASGANLVPPGAAIHIGIAVDTPQGLVVPVLRNAATAPLADLDRRLRELIAAAQSRRLQPADVSGAAFSISNLGAFGIDAFTPVINYPETAILGVGAIRQEAVVLASGGIAVRPMMTLSLTFDHRATDGAPAARFLQTLVDLIERTAAE
ncbi:MAG: 2-oxo acid dehydrogenase subunit E2 [Acidobacteria bacterium]|nr:2-oxo acid dehydrogenase subunit E2 [Acidobacteriota bacterium]